MRFFNVIKELKSKKKKVFLICLLSFLHQYIKLMIIYNLTF